MHNILACLQEQSFKDFEVIFVIDALQKIEEKHFPNVRYLYVENDYYRNNASYLRNL